ncbi:MAG TPA: restriction endonuclease subunit S [Candidatus Kryptonia bacterium]
MKVSVARFSESSRNDRIDSEFFRDDYVKDVSMVSGKRCDSIRSVASVSDGNHLKIAEEFTDSPGVRYLRGQDLSTDMVLSDRNVVFIPDDFFRRLKRSHIFRNDILITIVGANTGLVGLVFSPPQKLVASCKLGIIRPTKSILPGYLYSFLAGRYGQSQVFRSIRGGGQTGLILPDLKKLVVVRFEKEFECQIHEVATKAHSMIASSTQVYKAEEQRLLKLLGFANWRPRKQLSFVRNFSMSTEGHRIDAEYFQPMYDETLRTIKNYRHGFGFVSELFKSNKAGFKVKRDALYQYVEIGSVDTSSGQIEPLSLYEKDLPANAKIKLNKGDLIISKVRTYRGAVAIVQSDDLIGSGAFTVLQESKKINKETAYVFFKSAPILNLSLKYNAGTSYPVIDETDILGLPFPLIPVKVQQAIRSKITEMYETRALSKRLLEIAKRGVEMAIEKNEKEAEMWMNKELQAIDKGQQ